MIPCKKISIYYLLLIGVSAFFFVPGVCALDKTLSVYVGAHPDDIDIGMSGTLFKNDAGIHPVLWIVTADGGADNLEYRYESSPLRTGTDVWGVWVTDPVSFRHLNYPWKDPDGTAFTRDFYSYDLAQKRCGFIDGDNAGYGGPFRHPSASFGWANDWQTRVNQTFGTGVIKKVQMHYTTPSGEVYYYPDGDLKRNPSLYTDTLAEGLAKEIHTTISDGGYNKDMILIHSHAPDEVAKNYDPDEGSENADHKITGNAVREAISILTTRYGYPRINATWFTVYRPINPKFPFTATPVEIRGDARNKKTALVKAVWETEFIYFSSYITDPATGAHVFRYGVSFTRPNTAAPTVNWNTFPDDPGDYEYTVQAAYPENRSVTRAAPPLPGITADGDDHNGPTIRWEPLPDAAGYSYYVDNTSAFLPQSTNTTSVTLPRQPGGTHIFFIQARDARGMYGTLGSCTFVSRSPAQPSDAFFGTSVDHDLSATPWTIARQLLRDLLRQLQ
jgi:hypothetical protein